ncbi:MAG: carboxypeptidase M32, partial [Candidatus Eisenbacteria bacterium]
MKPSVAMLYDEFIETIREIYYLGSVAGLLGWDQQTMMPPGAAPLRAAQSSLLAGMLHDRLTHPRLSELLDCLEGGDAGLDEDGRANVRETRRIVDRACKIPRGLAREIAETQALSQQEWVAARAASDFARFAPWLEKMLSLRRHEADAVGYSESRYDALLDEYEPAMTASQVA